MRERILAVLALCLLLPQVGGAQTSSYPATASAAGTGETLFLSTTSTPTTGTSEEILYTFTTPANTWTALADEVQIEALFTTAANANAKVPRLRHTNVAGTNLGGVSVAVNAGSFAVKFRLIALDATSRLHAESTWSPTAGPGSVAGISSTTCTFSGACVFVITGLTAVSAGDLTLIYVKVTKL